MNTEKDRQLWPREQYREDKEKVGSEEDHEIYPRDEYRAAVEKTQAEEEKIIYPRGEFRTKQEDREAVRDFQTYESVFHRHFESNISEPGTTFDQYRPAYRYGYNLAVSERFKDNKEWEDLEPNARRYWEDRNPGTWDRYKDCIRKAWEKVKSIRMQPNNG